MPNLVLNANILLLMVVLASGCAVNRSTATVDPTADLANIKSMYVAKLSLDDRGIDQLIAEDLKKRGYFVSSGTNIPSDIDAIVTYKDKWMWDITMYMLELTVSIRNPKTDFPLATGNSYHTSLTRKSPEEMVDEVLNNIFSKVE